MKLNSPVVAMLWELWRLTRTEAAWKLALPLGAGMAALALSAALAPPDNPERYQTITDFGALIALVFLVVPNFLGWLSFAQFNSGRPGFPLRLLYCRPVSTAVMVGLPLAYLCVVPAVIYVVSAFLLRAAFAVPFPLLPVAAWISVLNVIGPAIYWSTRSRVVLALGIPVVWVGLPRFARYRLNFEYHDAPELWPTIFDFTLTDSAVIALIGLVAFGVTVAQVTRQRRGDVRAAIPSPPGGGLWGWLIDLFRLPCPTASATRAQVWFDLKSKGLPLLTIGVALAIAIPLLFAAGGPVDAALHDQFHVVCEKVPGQRCFILRGMSWFFAMISPLIILVLAGNAFDIRWGRGRISTFDAAQAGDTARLAALRILVRSGCVLAAIAIIEASLWTSMSIFGAETFRQVTNVPLSSFQVVVAARSWYELLALAVIAAVGVVVWVAAFTVLGALWTRYSRRGNIVVASLLLSVLALVLLALAEHNGIVSPFVADAIFASARWIFLAALLFSSVYVFWSGIAERLLTIRYVSGALAISAVFGVTWQVVLNLAGEDLAGTSAINAAMFLSLSLLPLTFAVLAPWSLNRIRHL